MADRPEDKKPVTFDILDDIKNAEKKIRRASFLKMIPKLKKMATELNIIKAKSKMMLEEVGLDEKDIKRVIDFINQIPSVELSKSELETLRESVKEDISDEKKEIEKQMDNNLLKSATLSNYSTTNWGGGGSGSSTAYYSSIGDTFTNGTGGGAGGGITLTAGKDSLNVGN